MNTHALLATLTLCLAAALTAGGCEAPSTATSPGLGDPALPPMNDPQISVLAPDLQPWLGFAPAVVARDGRVPLHVQVPVRNLTNRKYLIDYRVLFYDGSGLELGPTMGWAMVPMYPKQNVRLAARAMDAAAETFRVEVKWAQQ